MHSSDAFLHHARDARITPFAFGVAPAWLWSADATRIVWANAAGAALLGAESPSALGARQFGSDHPAGRELARLSGTLPSSGAGQLARLRGLLPTPGRILTCTCARIRLSDGLPYILVVAAERVPGALPLAERVRRALGETPEAAVFSADGDLLHAGELARAQLAGHATLESFGAGALATQALAGSPASGATALGTMTLEKFGAKDSTVLLATLEPAEAHPEPAQTDEDAEAPAAADAAMAEPADVAAEAPASPQAVTAADADTGVPSVLHAEAIEVAAEISEASTAADLAAPPAEELPLTTVEAASHTDAHPEITAAPDEAQPVAPDEAQPVAPESLHEESAVASEVVEAPSSPADSPHVLTTAENIALLDAAEVRLVQRRHPLRFVWTIDPQGCFAIAPGEFTALAGSPTSTLRDRTWDAVVQDLDLDPEGRVGRAVASHDTFSSIVVAWPAEASTERLPVVLSGLPVLDRERMFRGYRGFGVCREVDRIAAVLASRRAALVAVDAQTDPAGSRSSSHTSPSAETDVAATDTHPENGAVDAPATPASTLAAGEARPQFTVVPPSKNVVPFRSGAAGDKRPALNAVERTAFQEIARALGARFESEDAVRAPAVDENAHTPDGLAAPPPGSTADAATPHDSADSTSPADDTPSPIADEPSNISNAESGTFSVAEPDPSDEAAAVRSSTADASEIVPASGLAQAAAGPAPAAGLASVVLDRLPLGVLIYRSDAVIFANRTLLEWTGFADGEALAAAGGIEALFAEPTSGEPAEPDGASRALALRATNGTVMPVEVRLSAVTLDNAKAMMLTLMRAPDKPSATEEPAGRAAEATASELRSILDTATDGVVVTGEDGRVLSLNRSAEALFGYERHELEHRSFLELFAPESQRDAADYLEGLTRSGVASLLNDGREVIGRVRQGGLIPLFMTMGRIADAPAKFCAVLRDITQWKRAEEELTAAKQQAEKTSSAKSDFLAKISHEIRTPLNAIIGFSEVMLEQRFGPVGNDRYREYLKDIHTSGEHMISLLNDLLDLSKIEAGKLDLTFTQVNLNDAMQQCVAIMQPQANRERIIIRSALASGLPPVVADTRSVRQIILNLLSNSIKFTGAGGQVIVSTALTDTGEAVLRVRDTGVGMNEKDIEMALQPFRQLPTAARPNTAGTGLGLPLTKALAEANRAAFHIKSAVNAGTLVEIVFPANRVLAE